MRRILALVLALALTLTLVPISCFMASADQIGNFTYTVSNAGATITKYTGVGGVVDIPQYLGSYPVVAIGDNAFNGVMGLFGVNIPESVTSIGYNCFLGCTGLTEISIPDKVAKIGDTAFSGCTGLRNVTIGSGVTSIGKSAFYGCTGLTSINIPDNVITLGTSVFQNCTYLASIRIGNGVTSLPDNLFLNCTGLSTVTIGSKVSSISLSALKSCTGLSNLIVDENNPVFSSEDCVLFNKSKNTLIQYLVSKTQSYIIPQSVQGISADAFANCSQLTGVTIPTSVTDIGMRAFSGCTRLTEINLPDSVTSVKEKTFFGCTSLSYVNLPGISLIGPNAFAGCTSLNNPILSLNLNIIDTCAFQNCTGLTQIVLPESVKTIGDSVFAGCTGLLEITIPNYVTTIGASAFSGCKAMTKAIIGTKVSSIGGTAFKGCISLKKINLPDSLISMGTNTFEGCTGLTDAAIGDGLTIIPAAAFLNCTSLVSFRIGAGFENGWTNSFQGCTALSEFIVDEDNMMFSSQDCVLFNKNKTELIQYLLGPFASYVVPSSVTTIREQAFYGCTQLTGITMSNNVSIIGTKAFYGCKGLTTISIPSSVTELGDYIFQGCTGLTSVSLPSTLKSIGNYTFSGCSGLLSLEIPGRVFSIGNNAFENCTKVQSLSLPNSLMIIGNYAFYKLTSLKELVIPQGVRTIGSYAFSTCSALIKADINDTVTAIGTHAFDSCTSLTNLKLSKSITSISDCAFTNCKALTYVTIPEGVSNIGSNAFSSCSFLRNVDISNSVTQICNNAFAGCAFETLLIPSNVSTIGAAAFQGCGNLNRLVIGKEVTTIGDNAFKDCKKLNNVVIPEKVSTIGSNAFSGCASLGGAYFFGHAPMMGTTVFNGCPASFKVYYQLGKTGFSNPWNGYPTQIFTPVYDIVMSKTPTAITCGNVTVTIVYPMDSVEMKFKIDDGEWFDYKDPIVITSACMVYARSSNIYGNISENSIYIDNIDKTAPAAPAIHADIQGPTNSCVTITISYPNDSTVRQYRQNSGAWQNYSLPVVISKNCIIDARCCDEAGNVSDISTLNVNNIDNSPPIVEGVTNNSTYIGPRKITFTGGTATLDGKPFTSGSTVSSGGFHKLVVRDEAGNSVEINFTIVIRVSQITLNQQSLRWPVGKSGTLIATIEPANADNKAVSWSSNNSTVVQVDENGKIKSVSTGLAVITCTAKDGSGVKATCEIRVYPAAPATIKAASASYNSIKISWSAANGASGYGVYRYDPGTKTYTWLKGTTATSYTDTSLTTGTCYYYAVKAYKLVNDERIYGSVSATANAKPVPNAPATITAVSASYNSVKITWSAVSGASGYGLYRYDPGKKTYTWLKGTTATSYTDTSRTTGTYYYYAVKAYRKVNGVDIYGPVSAVSKAKPIPATPGSFNAVRASSSSIKLSWSSVAGATGYKIYRATSSSGPFTLIKTTTSLSYVNKGLTKNKVYYYKAVAYRTVNGTDVCSAYTAVKSAKPY